MRDQDSQCVLRLYLKHSRQIKKKVSLLLICHYVWRQVLFGGPQHDTQGQLINYRVLVFPVCISIAGAWLDEWLASRTSDDMS